MAALAAGAGGGRRSKEMWGKGYVADVYMTYNDPKLT